MNRVVHVLPVRERRSFHTGEPVVLGSEVERRERKLSVIAAHGDVVADAPPGEEGHTFWPSVCRMCNQKKPEGSGRSRLWTLAPHDVTPGYMQATLVDLPSLRGRIQPGVGPHGEVSGGSGDQPPEWMTQLAKDLDERGITYDLDRCSD